MSRLASFMYFIICINLAAWVINQSGFYPISQILWLNPNLIMERFALNVFAGIAASGAITGIISLLTRTQVFASYALIIWVIGILLSLGLWFLGGLPTFLAFILPPELWYISSIIQAFCTVSFFFFFMEVASQRQIL